MKQFSADTIKNWLDESLITQNEYNYFSQQLKMKERIENGKDPLTGEKMKTIGVISYNNGKCNDETGKEVTLNINGTWIYK